MLGDIIKQIVTSLCEKGQKYRDIEARYSNYSDSELKEVAKDSYRSSEERQVALELLRMRG